MRTINQLPPRKPEQPLSVGTYNGYTLIKPRASELSQQFGISIPSAYRHIQRGTTPASVRRRGRDGRSYPATLALLKPRRSLLNKYLSRAERWIVKASSHAEAEPDDKAKLAMLVLIATGTLEKWRAAT